MTLTDLARAVEEAGEKDILRRLTAIDAMIDPPDCALAEVVRELIAVVRTIAKSRAIATGGEG